MPITGNDKLYILCRKVNVGCQKKFSDSEEYAGRRRPVVSVFIEASYSKIYRAFHSEAYLGLTGAAFPGWRGDFALMER
jgi:hypothetical protein